MEPIYFVSEGILLRKGNTLYFVNKDVKRALPIQNISEIYCLAKVSLKSGAISLLLKHNIPVHFFNKYGFYEGTLEPKEDLISGKVIVAQAVHYHNLEKRLEIAKEMVRGIKHNILFVLKYYNSRGKTLNEEINKIEDIEITGNTSLQIMGIESQIWKIYYSAFNKILRFFNFTERKFRPPSDEINSLISFGNSLLYATVISELYKTYLHPSISYLHEPLERRYSLALDIADIFKPIIVERLIFYLVNHQIIKKDSFNYEGIITLKDNAKRTFIQAYNEKINTTVMHPTLKRRVSYRALIKFEGYKLVKHILGDKKYSSFKAWW